MINEIRKARREYIRLRCELNQLYNRSYRIKIGILNTDYFSIDYYTIDYEDCIAEFAKKIDFVSPEGGLRSNSRFGYNEKRL